MDAKKLTDEQLKWMKVAHDLQAPLMALKVGAGKLSGGSEKELIDQAISRLSDIVAEVLKPSPHSAVETSATEAFPAWSPTSVFEILQEKMAVYPGVEFQIKVEVCDEVAARIPARTLDRVISNLLNNACEANGFTGTVSIRVIASDESYTVEIEDQGPGLPEGFAIGLCVSTKAADKAVRGLGLYSAVQAISAYGKLEFTRPVSGNGTVVRLRLGERYL